MRNKLTRSHGIAVFGFLCTLLTGCTNDQLPIGATMQITPDDRSINVVELRGDDEICLYIEENYVDLPVVVTLVDGQQSPIGGADISVYVDFAENTYTGVAALKLYQDNNGNGVIDDESEYLSGIDDPIARVRTRDLSGDSNLLLRVNLSCAFRGEIFAFSDGVSASASISVEAISSPTTSAGG